MAKVTSKRQVTIPKEIADRYGIASGDEVEFRAQGAETIQVRRAGAAAPVIDRASRLALFDAATERQHRRQAERPNARPADRGWSREELYQRGRPR